MRQRSRSVARGLLLGLALTAMMAAACGGDDDDKVASTNTPLAVTSPVQQPTSGSAAAQATTAGQPTPAQTAIVLKTYADPFDYCTGVKDQLHPDAKTGYVGQAEPAAIVKGLELASGAAPGGLQHFADQGAVYWRCMAGAVYGCSPGANLQCFDPDTNTTPTKAMQDYCVANPDKPIPAVVTGHSTIYEWLCTGKTAVKGKQVFTLDPAGMNASVWFKIAKP